VSRERLLALPGRHLELMVLICTRLCACRALKGGLLVAHALASEHAAALQHFGALVASMLLPPPLPGQKSSAARAGRAHVGGHTDDDNWASEDCDGPSSGWSSESDTSDDEQQPVWRLSGAFPDATAWSLLLRGFPGTGRERRFAAYIEGRMRGLDAWAYLLHVCLIW
jgi:hypothetical protein